MADYTIINGTGSALASGGVTTAAYTIETGVTLTDENLAIVAALNGVAVMQDAASAAELAQVGNLLVNGSGAAPTVDYDVYNGSAAALSNVNAGGDDVGLEGAASGVALTASELKALLATEGVLVGKNATGYNLRRKAAKVLRYRKKVAL